MARLTKKFCDSVSKPGRFGDGLGLHLFVKTSGSKSWVQRLTVQGTRVDRGLGPWPAISLTRAREAAIEHWRVARRGGDPWAGQMAARGASRVPTLATATAAVLVLHADSFKSPRTLDDWRSTFARYLYPTMGERAVNEITVADVLTALSPVWRAKRETAKRLRQRLSGVFKWTIAHGYRTDDPAGPALAAVLPKNGSKHVHHEAVPHRDVAATLARLRASQVYPGVVDCIEFLVLTAARSAEARGTRWEEIDMAARVWTCPGERMKAGEAHAVPLSEAALAVLERARTYSTGSGLAFPGCARRTDPRCRPIARPENVGMHREDSRLPVELPGLVRRDGTTPRAGGDLPSASDRQRGRKCLRAIGVDRAPPSADAILGEAYRHLCRTVNCRYS